MTSAAGGQSVPRADLRDKLTGNARHSSGLKLPGMVIGQVLRRPDPHTGVLSIDTSGAAQLPGVYTIVAPVDTPETSGDPAAGNFSLTGLVRDASMYKVP